MTFPPDLPPPWYGIVLLCYFVGGFGTCLIATLMVAVFTLRRRIVEMHTWPLFIGLVVFMYANGIAQVARGMMVWEAFETGTITWTSIAQLRAVCIIIRAISSIWILAAIMEAFPAMQAYRRNGNGNG